MTTPVFDFDDLITPWTRAEVESSIYSVLGTLGVNTTNWREGAVIRSMITGTAITLSAFSTLAAKMARAGFLDLSESEWLRTVAYYSFGYTYRPETYAEGALTIVNAGGGIYDYAVDEFVVRNSITKKEYRNVEAISILNNVTTTIAIRAVEAGKGSDAGVGDIDEMTTPLTGVTISNPAALVGYDIESDASVRANAKEKLGTLSPFGPWDAYSYAAKHATLGDTDVSAGVTRVRITKDGFGVVDVYCATASGALTGDVNDPTTPLGAVDYDMQHNAAPLAVTLNTHSATVATLNVTYEAWAYDTSGHSPSEIEQLILDALNDYVRGQPIGGNVISPATGKIFKDKLAGIIADALPEIYHVVVTLPAADFELDTFEVAVLGGVSATAIHLSAPPEGFGGA